MTFRDVKSRREHLKEKHSWKVDKTDADLRAYLQGSEGASQRAEKRKEREAEVNEVAAQAKRRRRAGPPPMNGVGG